MDLTKLFGSLLTLLGAAGLIYTAYFFIEHGLDGWVTGLVVFIISTIFFSSGTGMIKSNEKK